MRARHKKRADGEDDMPVRRTATKRKTRKTRVALPKEVPVTEGQLMVLTDYLQETLGITLAQAKRAARALKPGSRVFGRGQTPPSAFIPIFNRRYR